MERVTRAEAARALGVGKATIWRWIDKHPALLGDDGLVDLTELRSHRDAVANPKLQTRSNLSRTSEKPGVEIAPGRTALNDHRAQAEKAKAIHAELDLLDRLKMTLEREKVVSEIAAAGAVLKRKAFELAKDHAEPLTRIDDPRAMERALTDLMHRLLEQGANALVMALPPAYEDDR